MARFAAYFQFTFKLTGEKKNSKSNKEKAILIIRSENKAIRRKSRDKQKRTTTRK